jgi:type I restriction enzyme M protein
MAKASSQEPLEKQLWKAADKLRKNIDAAEYKHVVLGLIFLKYISDSFEQYYEKLKTAEGELSGADPEDKDEYKAENIFFVPQQALAVLLISLVILLWAMPKPAAPMYLAMFLNIF